MTCIKNVSLTDVNETLRLSFSPLPAYEPAAYTLSVGDTLSLPTANKGTLSVTVSRDTITVDRTKAVTTVFHDCFKDSAYSVFTAPRTCRGDCDLLIIEDSGFFEIFADHGTLLFSVNTY